MKPTRNKRRNNNSMEDRVRRNAKLLEGVETIDYKDTELLRKFMTERGKIMPARLLGTNAKQQRQVKRAIRRARIVGLVR